MLAIYSSTHIQPLAERLAQQLSQPLEDPMATEWIAVPSAGIERWLRLELARTLGAGPAGNDGIAANIDFGFPGSLRSRLLAEPDQSDPWRLEHMVWSVLHVLMTCDDPAIELVRRLPPGASWYSRARNIADLFDRYSYHRPRMLRGWLRGDNNDGSGGVVAQQMAWQPALWRLVRSHINSPSPPERLADRLAEIEADPTVVDLPPRLAIFGVSTLPGGPQFLELLKSVGTTRDVGLYLLDPSLAAADAIATLAAAEPLIGATRAEDHSDAAIANPLLRSWGRPTREAQVQLADAVQHGVDPIQRLTAPPSGQDSLLNQLQADIRSNTAPEGTFVAGPNDNSLQIHGCHGALRQVEVLREVILGLLAADSSLTEDDVLVVVGDIVGFAPLISAVFGQSAPPYSTLDGESQSAPRLRYRITDRSLRASYPLLNATAALFELVAGRFGASDVLDFCALAPVRARFGFTDEHLAEIGRWVEGANIAWGLDGRHRSRWGLPPDLEANSWQAGLDQLLMGVAVHDDEPSFGPGQIAPYGVEGTSVEILGRFAELVHELAILVGEVSESKTINQWCKLTSRAVEALFDIPWSEQWQRQRLAKVLDGIGQAASVETNATDLTLRDFRRVLASYFVAPASRSGFFEGGITITSLQPMRWIPHRVICVLGADSELFGSSGVNGDDLVATAPRIGDPDLRGEQRQAMLELLMSATENFVVTRTGHDLRANVEVPAAVPVTELLETARATLAPDSRHLQLERIHPRQAYDESNFIPAGSHPPFGFDPAARDGALARRSRFTVPEPFLRDRLQDQRLESVDLAALQTFFRKPVRYFFRERLNVVFDQAQDAKPDHLPIDLDSLEQWQMGTDLIEVGLNQANAKRFIAIQKAKGALPPGFLGDTQAEKLTTLTDLMFAELKNRELKHESRGFEVHGVVGGLRLTGQVVSWATGRHPGPTVITFSRFDGRHLLSIWLDLLAMTLTDSQTDWHGVGLAKGKAAHKVTVRKVRGDSAPERRINAGAGLAMAVDLFRRGHNEPLPLFPKSSYELWCGRKISNEWDGYYAERADEYHAAVFGHLDSRALMEIPLRADDPPGVGDNRIERYARLLWDCVDATTIEVDQ